MKTPVLLLFAGLLLTGPHAGGDEPVAAAGSEASSPAASPQATAVPGPERSGKKEEKLESFAPSERLPADSAISFPVDI